MQRRSPVHPQARPRGPFLPVLTTAFAALLAACLALSLAACSGGGAPRAPDPLRVEAHTAGFVAGGASLRVVLAAPMGVAGGRPRVNPFRLEPAVDGQVSWEDERTLVFAPSRPLAPGRLYKVRFDLGLLESGAPGKATDDWFDFSFRTIEQRVAVDFSPLRAAEDGSLVLEGSLSLAEGAPAAAVEAALAASGGAGKGGCDVSWSHDSPRLHRFAVKGITRAAAAGSVAVSWKGASLGASGSGSRSFRVPGSGSFELLGLRAVDEGGSLVELSFSEPLDKGQDLRGLVSVDGVEGLRYDREGGRLRLYAPAWPASAKIRVEPGLRASDGRNLVRPVAAEVAFAWEKPEVRFLTKSAILPTSQGLALPVETMNLSALVVEAVRIRGDNMLQFLQVNDLDSSSELRRVGEVVWRKTIDLGWKEDWKNRWVRQGLDLSPLLAESKDGMLQIRVTFRKDHIRYVCPNEHDFRDLRFPSEEIIDREEGEFSLWDYVESWGNDGYGQFYKYKDDPCHPAYYLPYYDHDITKKRNVLVSDLGATARREAGGAWTFAASDLRSAAPLSGAAIGLYNFQRRLLAEGKTGEDGQLRLPAVKEPAFAVVSLGAQRSYLKLDPGSSLAVSHFDVGGERADDGLKGFIYGERGVWRPGDPIHLTFILSDRDGTIPANHPVLYELEDPRGRVLRSGTATGSLNGFYSIETSTNQDSPTGPYLARVKLGGRTFTKSLRVETVMPNRLKIKLELGAGSAYLSRGSGALRLESAWLTGAPAGALRADISATFAAAPTSFGSYRDYSFDDPTRTISGERAILFEGELGPDGKVAVPVELAPEGLAPGKLRATLLTRIFEPSGVFSSETAQFDYHPYERYVGLKLPKGDQSRGMLLTDQEHKVELALVDRDGKPLRSGTVEVSLYQLEWRWWWEKGDESLAETADDLYARPLKREKVRVENGRAEWSFRINYPNWGRYLVRAEDATAQPARASSGRTAAQGTPSHAAGSVVYVDWPGYAGKGRGEAGGAASMLSLQASKEKYAVGEKAQLSFPSNAEGRALVAIERAGRLLRQEWVRTKPERTSYEFTLTPDMAPNVYVHVSFLQPHLQTANDLPIRLYGVVPVMVEDPATRIAPLVDAPAEIEPNSDVSFSVREASGRAMTCTVAVVDEGLLGITRYSAPNPWNEFYKKEASALASYDLYQYVAGAFSGKLETLLAVGGGDEGLGGGNRKVSRFPPVVTFFPPFEVKAGETVRKSFRMGPYVGAVRFMVVAGTKPSAAAKAGAVGASAGAAYGVVEKEVPVRSKLMAQLTAPRVLSPEEEAAIPATVFAFLGKKRVRVTLEASGAAVLSGPGEGFVDFEADGDRVTSFRIKALPKPGAARLVLRAEADGFSATQTVDLEVRPLGSPVSTVAEAGIEAGKEWQPLVELPGAPGTNAVSIELARLPTLNLGERLAWLLQYPHGCAEQTTSKAFPQLYLPEAVALGPERVEEARRNVRLAIAKLGDFQTPRGGFAFWPGEGSDEDWLSAYVVHFLVAARRSGYEVPDGLLDPALAYLAQGARLWNSKEAWSKSIQAYRLYVLALAGKPEPASMNRFREYKPFPAAAQYRLAAAYALSGQREAADALVRSAPVSIDVYEGLEDRTYGTPFRDRAAILEALNAMGDLDRGLPLYRQLAGELNASRWLSTQEIGAALSAGLPFAARAAAGEAPELLVTTGPGPARRVRLDRSSLRLDAEAGEGETARYSIRNLSKTPVYARVVARGTPAIGSETAVSDGLSISLRYYDMDDNEVEPNSLALGSDLIVEAVVRNRTAVALKNLALTHVLPAGWEIANYRVGEELPRPREEDGEYEEPEPAPPPLYDYQDVRDDRVLTYFSLEGRAEKRFRIYVNKTYDGRFYLPPVSVEAMYDSRYQAVEPGRWLSDAPRADQKRRERNMKP